MLTMDREQARQEVRRRWREIIPALTSPAQKPMNGEISWICPMCGHGTHGDGLTYDPHHGDGNGLKCFGCNWNGDILDLWKITRHTEYNDALSSCAELLGIAISAWKPLQSVSAPVKGELPPPPPEAPENASEEAIATQAKPDLSEYFRTCFYQLKTDPRAKAYLESRGISLNTVVELGYIGFDPVSDPAGSGHKTPRIILPTSRSHYVARAIDPSVDKQYRKLNNKGGTPDIFNKAVIYSQDTVSVFVTEGAFDALSLLEIGHPAIALNSTSLAQKLVKLLEEKRPKAEFVLCLDNDNAGQAATKVLQQGMTRLDIPHVVANICGKSKDPNEALVQDRASFEKAATQALRQLITPDNVKDYIDSQLTQEIKEFKSEIRTGFPSLDRLSGGLYDGLYTVAAISSLGKTTFCHQIADQIAAAGNDVLFFSLEQSRLELVSKSIARRTAQIDKGTAVTSLQIRKGRITDAHVLQAAQAYRDAVGSKLSVIEGNFNCTITFIGEYVRNYIRGTGSRPVVFIDYLQILQPELQGTRQQTTKETVDTSITALKRLSREQHLTIFVVCSVNRSNYLTPIDFESLKESGGIEYTSDVIWGLQLQCLNESVFDSAQGSNIKDKRERINQAKAETPRKIELRCLKNRYGVASFSAYFDYYPAFDLFEESTDEFAPAVGTGRKAGRRIR